MLIYEYPALISNSLIIKIVVVALDERIKFF